VDRSARVEPSGIQQVRPFFKLSFTNVQISHMARTPLFAVKRDGLVTVLGRRGRGGSGDLY